MFKDLLDIKAFKPTEKNFPVEIIAFKRKMMRQKNIKTVRIKKLGEQTNITVFFNNPNIEYISKILKFFPVDIYKIQMIIYNKYHLKIKSIIK